MADNASTIVNPYGGKYDDWFELYNAGTNTADLSGYYLTGTLTDKTKFQIPNNGQYLIPPHGYFLVWADNNSSQNSASRPELHVNFKLSKSGDSIGLFSPDGTAIDALTFGAQTTDVSEGRFPDGAETIIAMPVPTPGAANVIPNTAPVVSAIGDKNVILGQTLAFTVSATDTDQPPQTLTFSLGAGAPAGAVINSVSGQFTWTPTVAPATNSVTVMATDDGVPNLSGTQTFNVITYLPPTLDGQVAGGGQFEFSWPAPSGLSYQVEYKTNLSDTVWTPFGGPLVGNGATLSITSPVNDAAQRFFRVRVLP
jgi:hypothetical protein